MYKQSDLKKWISDRLGSKNQEDASITKDDNHNANLELKFILLGGY